MRPWQSVSPAPIGLPMPSTCRSYGKKPATPPPSLSTATRAPSAEPAHGQRELGGQEGVGEGGGGGLEAAPSAQLGFAEFLGTDDLDPHQPASSKPGS